MSATLPVAFPLKPLVDLREDPLKGAYGLAWYRRKPTSLTPEEWNALHKALGNGEVLASDYFEWQQYVK